MRVPLWKRGAGELAEAIRAREVSSREVVEAHLARIAEVEPACRATGAVLADSALAAADALADTGYAVEERDAPRVSEAAALWSALCAADLRALMPPLLRPLLSTHACRFLDFWLAREPALDLSSYVQRLGERSAIARAWTLLHEEFPLVLGPVCTDPPFVVGRDLASEHAMVELLHRMRLVIALNLLGLPAAVVPVGLANGLPQAVQLCADRYREDLCLAAAEAIEDRLGAITPIDPRPSST